MRPTTLRTTLLVSAALVLATGLAPTAAADGGGILECSEEDDPDEAEQCACEEAAWSFNQLTHYKLRCVEEEPAPEAVLPAPEGG